MSDVTQLLERYKDGDHQAADELLPLVYEDLRRRATALMANEDAGQTLDATALVHEAYLRLVGPHRFADRIHFFRVAAEAMRRILVERARRKERRCHRARGLVEILDHSLASNSPVEDLLALDEALERFAAVDPLKAELVKLRYFAGLSEEETAAALDISRATASRYWAYARAWLVAAVDGNTG